MQTFLNHCLKTQILFPQRFLCCDTTLMICRNQISQRDLQSVYIANILPTRAQSAVPYLLKIWNTLSMPYFAITRSPWIHLYFSKSVFFTFFFFALEMNSLYPSAQRLNFFCFRVLSGAYLGGGCRGCVPPPPPPWDDLPFSNTTGILQKEENDVVYWCWSRARDECTPS